MDNDIRLQHLSSELRTLYLQHCQSQEVSVSVSQIRSCVVFFSDGPLSTEIGNRIFDDRSFCLVTELHTSGVVLPGT